MTIRELAEVIIGMVGSKSKIVMKPLPKDDPTRRQPNISLAKKELNWEPNIALKEGLTRTIQNFEERLKAGEKPEGYNPH